MDDAALVEAARNGDDTAWAAIYDRYADKLHDHCTRILRDRDEAADALHDAFLAAARNLDQLRDPSRLRPWMYSICRHTSLRRLKARDRVDLTDSPDDLMVAEPDLGRGVRTEELTELVWAAAAGLSGRDQALLDLHLRQGLEGQDLADAMGTSLNNSYVMLSRMRDQVERSLGALLIARLGREECDELDALLSGWDGHFSPLLRKRVARHVDGCDTCSARRKAVVSPLALLAAAPLVPAPSLLKTRVISSIRNVDVVDGPHVPFTKEGFAVLAPEGAERRVRATWFGAAAAVLLLLGVLFVARDSGSQSLVTASGATTSSLPTRVTTPDGSTIPTLVGEEPPVVPTSDGQGAGTTGGTAGGSAGTGSTGGGSKPGGGPASTTDTTAGSGATTTKPPDTAGPEIGRANVTVQQCVGGRRTIPVSVRLSDPSGVRSAVVKGAAEGPVSLSDSNGDGTWGGTVVTAHASEGLVLVATDRLGNVSTKSLGSAFGPCEASTTTTRPPATSSSAPPSTLG